MGSLERGGAAVWTVSLPALVRPKLEGCKMSTNGEGSVQEFSLDLKNVEGRQSVISLGEAKDKGNEVSLTGIFSLRGIFSSI